MVFVGIIPEIKVSGIPLVLNALNVAGSTLGSTEEIKEMLAFVVEHPGIKTWCTMYDMKDLNQALKEFQTDPPRYRFVLENKK